MTAFKPEPHTLLTVWPDRDRKAGEHARHAGGGLADARRDHVAHDELSELLGLDRGLGERRRDGLGPELRRV